MTDTERDFVIARALSRVVVPNHAPDFWKRLDRRLAVVGVGQSLERHGEDQLVPLVDLRPGSEPHRSRRRGRVVAVAAAAVVALTASSAVVVSNRGGGGIDVSNPASPGAPTPTSDGAPVEPASPPGSTEAVLEFLDELGSGNFAGAAARLGPRSEAYLNATAGSVDTFLRVAQEGYGAWAMAPDRTTTVVEVRPGDVVVVVSGALTVEGTVEDRADAFPARYSESVGVWFVEPWAFDPNTGGRLELIAPPPEPGRAPSMVGSVVQVATPADGVAWLAIDDAHAEAAVVGADRVATWQLSPPLSPGRHTLVVAFINDTNFSAFAISVDVDD